MGIFIVFDFFIWLYWCNYPDGASYKCVYNSSSLHIIIVMYLYNKKGKVKMQNKFQRTTLSSSLPKVSMFCLNFNFESFVLKYRPFLTVTSVATGCKNKTISIN